MVKGTSRRVIVVDSPDTDLFEQAIFIVRNDAMDRGGVTAQQLVNEACRVARSCSRSHISARGGWFRSKPIFWGTLGAGVTALTWLLSALI